MDFKKIAAFAFIVFALFSCNNPEENNHNDETETQSDSKIMILQPQSQQLFTEGDSIHFMFTSNMKDFVPDSSVIFFNNKAISRLKNQIKIDLLLDSVAMGSQSLRVVSYSKGKEYSASVPVIFKSNKRPVYYQYKILQTYPHDKNDYTQGYIYDNGFIYEGTGQNGESMLKKYKLTTGELELSYSLAKEDFGEGIVIHNNKIYQLTWQSGVAYEYEKETFKRINKFVLQTEGWGITNYHDKLIMSDGSNILYVLNPASFDVYKRIEVYDDMGPVTQLNELEYIDGKIFANIYTTDYVVIINPETGKVEGKIYLKGLLKGISDTENAEVLNGIAWKGEKNKILVTGKWWPKAFYIEFFE